MPDSSDSDPPATYAESARRKNAAYRKAYADWVAGLTAAERDRLRAKGLLEPVSDLDGSASNAPVVERGEEKERAYAQLVDSSSEVAFVLPEDAEGSADDGGNAEADSLRLRALRDFLCARGNPERDWAALRYLLGFGSCGEHARALGMTKQAFDYHVRTLQEALGLPPLGNQRSRAARKKYALANRRKLMLALG